MTFKVGHRRLHRSIHRVRFYICAL